MINTREIAYQCIYRVLEEGAFLGDVLDGTLLKYAYLEESDRHFLVRLVKGTVEKVPEIDFYINALSKTPVKKQKKEVRTILRMGIYQIRFMDSVKEHAAVNESVKLAGKHGYPGFKGFVNGILRNYIRKQDRLVCDTEEAKYSMPQWITDLFRKDLGEEDAIRVLEAFNKPSPLTIRLNLRKDSEENIVKKLEDEGLCPSKVAFPKGHPDLYNEKDAPAVYRISNIDSIASLESFREGYFYIQDLSSMLPPVWAGIKPGMAILDVCAAPGGKTLIAAEMTGTEGSVLSRDKDEKKAALIRENIERAGLSNVTVEVHDATEASKGRFDVVIADLPCSGLGVIGRKSDLKYRIKKEDLEELQDLQRQILIKTVPLVKEGALLCYSTCTLDRLENEDQRKYILDNFPEMKLLFEKTVLPFEYDSDGFYIAVFRKNQETYDEDK